VTTTCCLPMSADETGPFVAHTSSAANWPRGFHEPRSLARPAPCASNVLFGESDPMRNSNHTDGV
jgi:hypothetical protein